MAAISPIRFREYGSPRISRWHGSRAADGPRRYHVCHVVRRVAGAARRGSSRPFDRSRLLDCAAGGQTPIDTGAFRQARQQGLIVIAIAPTWGGHSIFFSAAGRHGLHVWRQRLSPITFNAHGAPELLTPGGESAFFPTVAHGRLGCRCARRHEHVVDRNRPEHGKNARHSSTPHPRFRFRQSFLGISRRKSDRVFRCRTTRARTSPQRFRTGD